MVQNHPLTAKLIDWYKDNKRELPWRDTKDPYRIWISEIILQQTRVAQGLDYYLRFVERFPTLESLACAEEDEVFQLWQGLGYYSRARNIMITAQTICREYGGVFPNDYNTILKLKGIGPYTAAAISSFAFRHAHAAVDGNVYRILARLFDIDSPIDKPIGQKEFQALADALLDYTQPDLYNQATMELGATICLPKKPKCGICPVEEHCVAKAKQTIDQRPIKMGKTKVRNRYFTFLELTCNDKVVIEKRGDGDIWASLYQYPLLETNEEIEDEQLGKLIDTYFDSTNHTYIIEKRVRLKKHQLSHQSLYCSVVRISLSTPIDLVANQKQVEMDTISQYALPQILVQYLNQ